MIQRSVQETRQKFKHNSNLTSTNFALTTYTTMGRTRKQFPRDRWQKETLRHIHKVEH